MKMSQAGIPGVAADVVACPRCEPKLLAGISFRRLSLALAYSLCSPLVDCVPILSMCSTSISFDVASKMDGLPFTNPFLKFNSFDLNKVLEFGALLASGGQVLYLIWKLSFEALC